MSLISIKTTLTGRYTTSLQPSLCRIHVLWHCNDVVCPLGRRYFLKKDVSSFEKQSAR